jgi:hypothetical protein
MNYTWYDLAGNVGVASILITYLLLQMNKIKSSDPAYSVLNAVGASLILTSLIFEFNLSAFLIEFFWLLISIYGIIKAL